MSKDKLNNKHLSEAEIDDVLENPEKYYGVPIHMYNCMVLPVIKEGTSKEQAGEMGNELANRTKELNQKIQALIDDFNKQYGLIKISEGISVGTCNMELTGIQSSAMGTVLKAVSEGDFKKLLMVTQGLDLFKNTIDRLLK